MVPVYPGYVASILCSILLGRPVKWIEDKSGNLISTGYARHMYVEGELALRRDGTILATRFHADTDQGAFFADAQPSKFKIGLMHSAFACYGIPHGYAVTTVALLRVVLHLRHVSKTLAALGPGVDAIAESTAPVGPVVGSVNRNLEPVRDFCEQV